MQGSAACGADCEGAGGGGWWLVRLGATPARQGAAGSAATRGHSLACRPAFTRAPRPHLRISRLLLAPSCATHTRSTSSVPSAATAAAKPAVPPPTPK
jgi:hypothetical protein